MNRTPPEYFEPIRQAAERRWKQLEADPELAAPWHQLFRQVQSPRHVLSELLQNADDAGATDASARVINGVFEFTHNGEDFSSDNLSSLCRFGYSNKRSLHTIGFRGIGFKSTFSLGPVVGICTPSLSIYFEKERFTLPCWYEDHTTDPNSTCILVKIQDELRQAELEKNLGEWRQSPVSLLFFRNIRRLTLENHQLLWQHDGVGPSRNSEWLLLQDSHRNEPDHHNSEPNEKRVLLVKSEYEEFPDDCLAEIKQERILGADSEFCLPPSRVELVLGAGAGVYVVLPTAVKPDLPFLCNGAFMQDPARVKIKDPEISPTNRWLLSRIGSLAASCMCNWLSNTGLELIFRANAYNLMPQEILSSESRKNPRVIHKTEQSTESVCTNLISTSFYSHLENKPVVLAHDGTVENSGKCIALDKQVRDVWDLETFSRGVDPETRKVVCRATPDKVVEQLLRMGYVDKISRSQFCVYLKNIKPPNPGKEKLLQLWVYIASELTKQDQQLGLEDIALVPVEDKDQLYPPRSTVYVSNSKGQLTDADIHWIAKYILFVDREWLLHLTQSETDRVPIRVSDSWITAREIALALLKRMGLADGSDITKTIERLVTSLEASNALEQNACIRLAHICARLACLVPGSFPYITQSGAIRYAARGVCTDRTGILKNVLPETYYDKYFLSGLYASPSATCSIEDWTKWLASDCPALRTLPPLKRSTTRFRHANELIDYISVTYGENLSPTLFPYKWKKLSLNQYYVLVDYDFEKEVIEHWQVNNSTDSSLVALAEVILKMSCMDWFSWPFLEIYQTNTNGLRETLVEDHDFAASWLRRFKATACIPDTRGNYCRPSGLLRRSDETEPLLGIERFIEKRYDHSANETILSFLGVSAALPGPNLLLSLLGTLATLETPPRDEVVRLYEQLDKLYLLSRPEDQNQVIAAFQESNLLLTDQDVWSTTQNIFISADGIEGSGLLTVLTPTRNLSIWRQLGLRERPDAEAAIEILNKLPMNIHLEPCTHELVKTLMRRFCVDIISDCSMWVSLSRKLRYIDDLQYGLVSSGMKVELLFDETLDKCADLRFIDGYSLESLLKRVPIRKLEAAICYTLDDGVSTAIEASERPQWLKTFGVCISKLSTAVHETEKLPPQSGESLSRASIKYAPKIYLIPKIDGSPIGLPVMKEGVFLSDTMYVQTVPPSRLASLIPHIIGEYLQNPQLQTAAAYCYERPDELIVEYFKSNYGLANPLAEDPSSLKETSSCNHSPDSLDVLSCGDDAVFSPVSDNLFRNGKHLTNNTTDELTGMEDIARRHPTDSIELHSINDGDHADDEPAPPLSAIDTNLLSVLSPTQQPSPHADDGKPDSDNQIPTPGSDTKAAAGASLGKETSTQYKIVLRHAHHLGLTESGDGSFCGDCKTTLRRERGELFPWVLQDATGLVVKRFLVCPLPLVAAPLELDTIAYGLLERLPDEHSILLPAANGTTTEITGVQLQEMIVNGHIKVFPSGYRLALS